MDICDSDDEGANNLINDMLKTYRLAVVPLLIEKVSVLILLSY